MYLVIDKNCVNCGCCYWFEDGKFYKHGGMELNPQKYNGEIKKLINSCHLDCIHEQTTRSTTHICKEDSGIRVGGRRARLAD